MNQNLAQKLIGSHLVAGEMTPGEDIAIRIDQVLTHDATGPSSPSNLRPWELTASPPGSQWAMYGNFPFAVGTASELNIRFEHVVTARQLSVGPEVNSAVHRSGSREHPPPGRRGRDRSARRT